jgi:uncharacterized membrane protein YqjE
VDRNFAAGQAGRDIVGRTRGFGELLRQLVNGSADLLRDEVKLARLEVTEIVTNVGRGTALVALGGVLLLLGGLAFAAGLILLVGDQWLPRDLYWLAALLVMILTGALAAWLAKRGMTQLSPSNLAPKQTVQTLKEDKEWLKQRLTSGAT